MALNLRVTVGQTILAGRLEYDRAPATCASFERLLPLRATLLHVRWSGEATWVPLGDLDIGVDQRLEHPVHEPEPGQILLYPGGVSETEILIPYGRTRFAAKTGPLHGTHFLTIRDDVGALAEIGRRALWEGAQAVLFESVTDGESRSAPPDRTS